MIRKPLEPFRSTKLTKHLKVRSSDFFIILMSYYYFKQRNLTIQLVMDTRGRLNRLSKKQEIFRMNQSQCLLFQRSKFSIKSFEQIFCIVFKILFYRPRFWAILQSSKILSFYRQAEKTSPKETSENEESESENEFLDMSWPKGDWKKQLIYVFFLGITGPLWLLIPDVRREGKEKWVFLTFINSIIAIAIYRLVTDFIAQHRLTRELAYCIIND